MSHDKGSFDYKAINPAIADILAARSQLNNTTQVAMPFIKATTTVRLPKILGPGNIGFTLGLQGLDQNIKYEDMYSEKDSNMPLIGYTYQADGTTKRVYAQDPISQITNGLMDRRKTLYSNTDFSRVPPPGIIGASVGTNSDGRVLISSITISVPSLVQLETIHRAFMIPGAGLILEWGQQFAAELSPSLGELSDVSQYLFPWNNPPVALEIMSRLASKNVGLQEVLDKYTYPSQGQYMWTFGKIGSFNTKTNSDGSFECTIKIIGPAEDSWAYSTKNTVVPGKDPSSAYFCAEQSNSVYSYFTSTAAGKNFKSLLDTTSSPSNTSAWKDHVFKLPVLNKTEGEPTKNDQTPTYSEKTFLDSEDAYFISWRYFVNVILNDENNGVKSIFKDAGLSSAEIEKISLLLPYASGQNREIKDVSNLRSQATIYLDDPMECFVGYNPYLRSVDPSVMIIVNEEAASLAEKDPQYNILNAESIYKSTEKSREIMQLGLFDKSTSAYKGGLTDRGFLSSGIWINHKAIISSMIGANTVMDGIVDLLGKMSQATLNYWSLTLDEAHPLEEYGNSHNFMVVDSNFKDSSENAVQNFLDRVYTFNKYVSTDESGKLVGSEVTDCVIDISMPQLLFTKIATIGLIQPEDYEQAGVLSISGSDNPYSVPKLSGPNDAFRKMFALTVLTGNDGVIDDNIDLTELPKADRKQNIDANRICGSKNAQTTAETSGVGHKSDSTKITTPNPQRDQLIAAKEAAERAVESETCRSCETCKKSNTFFGTIPTLNSLSLGLGTAAVASVGKKLSELTVGTVSSLQSKEVNAIFAVGKYQAIPDTFAAWVSAEKIPSSAVFDVQLQEKLGDWLIFGKRPKVGDFVNGGQVSIDTANLELAKEFASIPIPNDMTVTRYRTIVDSSGKKVRESYEVRLLKGQSYYANDSGGNKSSHSVAEVQSSLLEARRQKSAIPLKKFIAKGEGGYDSLNRGKAGDTSTNSAQYYAALAGKNRRTGAQSSPTSSPPTSPTAPTAPTTTTGCGDDFYFSIGNNAALTREAAITNGKKICADCEKQKTVIKQTTMALDQITAVTAATREFNGMQNVFRYVEIYPEYMINNITEKSNGIYANAFGNAPTLLGIKADLTMPGINGMRVGELFWVDRIPSFYKAFGAFQILSIQHSISLDGWETKIHAAFVYLGNGWFNAVKKILNLTN